MHELIEYITEYELKLAEYICSHIHPDAIYHHDDWGSQTSSFMSPQMFREFLLEPYKKIYGYYKAHGVELIIHHSDSYLENMIPELIEAGIDIWQGVMSTNNIPEIIRQYGGKLTLMGKLSVCLQRKKAGVDSGLYAVGNIFYAADSKKSECGTMRDTGGLRRPDGQKAGGERLLWNPVGTGRIWPYGFPRDLPV